MGAIACLGLGQSLSLFDPSEFELSVGVNDIWKYHPAEAVVCLDKRQAFTHDRLKIIDECKPKAFYSHMVIYDTRPDFVKINLAPGYPEANCNIDTPYLQKSFCSPFVAVQIAWKYYFADEVHLFGVDLVDHPHLKGDMCQKIKVHFQNLKNALRLKNCQLIIHGDGVLSSLL
jgi:hypothetical protein